MNSISINDYQGTNIEKAFGIQENTTQITPELIKQVLDQKLEKGIIDQELHAKAIEQLDELTGENVEVTIEKGGPGSGKHKLYLRGGSIGEKREGDHPKHGRLQSEHDSLDEAKDKAKRFNKMLSPGEKSYYKLKYHVVSEKESSDKKDDLKKAYEILNLKYPDDQEDILEKAGKSKGEGSRGGHVIGHTKSGKPVYKGKEADHKDYKDFTAADHRDASKFHAGELQANRTKMYQTSNMRDDRRFALAALNEHHDKAGVGHAVMADKKEKEGHDANLSDTDKKIIADQKKKQLSKHIAAHDHHEDKVSYYEENPKLLHDDHHLEQYNFHKDRLSYHKSEKERLEKE